MQYLSHHHLFLWETLASSKMSGKREAVLALHRAGKLDSAIARTLLAARSTVWKILKRFKERGDLSDGPRCCKPCSQRSKSMIKCIRKRIKKNPKRHMRFLAKTANMSPRTMRRLVHKDLKMSSFTLEKRMSGNNSVRSCKTKRLERSKNLLKEFRSGTGLRLFDQLIRYSQLK